METILDKAKYIQDSQKELLQDLEDYLMNRLFDEFPEDKRLGKRIRVTIKDVKVGNGLGPHYMKEFHGISDLVASWTDEVSVDLNIVFVYHRKTVEVRNE